MKQDIATMEIPELISADEETVEYQEVEDEVFGVEGNQAYINQGYNSVDLQLGDTVGLTYYSQLDSRWKNIMYSSRGDENQTIGNSGCGPTASAMVVTSIKGVITPAEMAELYVEYRIQKCR